MRQCYMHLLSVCDFHIIPELKMKSNILFVFKRLCATYPRNTCNFLGSLPSVEIFQRLAFLSYIVWICATFLHTLYITRIYNLLRFTYLCANVLVSMSFCENNFLQYIILLEFINFLTAVVTQKRWFVTFSHFKYVQCSG